ncbi:MAG: M20 family metallopeptidase [Burkholderiales bacterium]|jgi:acetylornithine deacetylase/succinyl-diaminopimelate desuccinylase-like protein|nr:M20 family metallopeptidase [Burkholderiales bacterium]
MNLADLKHFTDRRWDEDLVPRLVEYVKVPAKSPGFDASWAAHGHLQAVVKEAHAWAAAQKIKGLNLEIVALEGKTPCIFFDVPATGTFGNAKTVLFYGHLDKQPEMVGWREGLGPWKPVVEDGKLYGRGSADDGYAIYAALTIVAALDAQGTPRPRCVGIIETCEESGSPDLPAYLDLLAPRFGDVALVAGLDSGCGNYEQLWVTTSLRGLVGGTMTVEVLTEGVHSGKASGLVPSSMRIARQLLNRIDDPATGRVVDPVFHADIPAERLQQAQRAGEILGDQVWKEFPWVGCNHGPAVEDAAHAHAMPTTTDPVEGILARTWRPALSVTGAAGFPSVDAAGNVLRPKTTFKLSLRLPPTVDGERATATMKKLLTENVPYNAKVTFDADWGATGWNAPATAPWLKQAAHAASRAVYGKDAAWMGEGGTIPFMNMLGEKFPRAQFLITGVLGPHSNAHGPNEFLHIPYVKQLTAAVAGIVTAVPG